MGHRFRHYNFNAPFKERLASKEHDFPLTWVKDSANSGEGLTIEYHWQETPFGDTLIMATKKGVCGLCFSSEMGREKSLADLKRWPKAHYIETSKPLLPALGEDVRLHLIGTEFQLKVWEALLHLPTGFIASYGDIADYIGRSKKAARAIGGAVGKNPLSWLVPCHRVLGANGQLGGYYWGLPLKEKMLEWEKQRFDALH